MSRLIHGSQLPYGLADLNPRVIVDEGTERWVKCYVQHCEQWLRPPRRSFAGDVCPIHGIRCHVSGATGTYSYSQAERNIIVARRDFTAQIRGHEFKFESHRLGSERSEDALTWNVFRSLYERRVLAEFVNLFINEMHAVEPDLYLWGINMKDFRAWQLLIDARNQFESNLPVERPLTEPDIALHLPGKYLILIEAKFTSDNTFYDRGHRKNAHSLTAEELVSLYHFPQACITNRTAASTAGRIPQQLWRNMVFAEYMARHDAPTTRAYHLNLVRLLAEQQIEAEFRSLLHRSYQDRFGRVTWEEIYVRAHFLKGLELLVRYLKEKTAGLRPAFHLPRVS